MVANRAGNVRLARKLTAIWDLLIARWGAAAGEASFRTIAPGYAQPTHAHGHARLDSAEKWRLGGSVRQYTHASALQHADTQYFCWRRRCGKKDAWMRPNVAFQRAARVSPNLAQAQKTAESLLAGK